MALLSISRAKRVVALLAALLFVFGSAGKAIAGVDCHRVGDAEGTRSAHTHAGGAHHGVHSSSGDGESQPGGAAPCDCLSYCHLSAHASVGDPTPRLAAVIDLAHAASIVPRATLVIRPPFFFPYPNGPPLSV